MRRKGSTILTRFVQNTNCEYNAIVRPGYLAHVLLAYMFNIKPENYVI